MDVDGLPANISFELMKSQTFHRHSLQEPPLTRQLQVLSGLKRLKFGGKIVWSAGQDNQWIFFLIEGNIVYGTGGIHPVRRFYRQVKQYAQALNTGPAALHQSVSQIKQPVLPSCPEYHLLYEWAKTGKISLTAFRQIVEGSIEELVFEMLQAQEIRYGIYRQSFTGLDLGLAKIAHDRAFMSAQSLWQDWLQSGLEDYSPHLAPVIRQPSLLQSEVSPPIYQLLTQLLDGQQSLQDIAVRTQRDIIQFLQVLVPYIQRDAIALVKIRDYPDFMQFTSRPNRAAARKTPLIACVDDSLMICQAMSQTIRAAGYESLSITEGRQAIGILLAKKPDIVFLDLVMPDTNGYEICTQLRKISAFKATPIIILSGNDGLVDQVRARLLGATDFLSKPMEPIVIMAIIQKYLEMNKSQSPDS